MCLEREVLATGARSNGKGIVIVIIIVVIINIVVITDILIQRGTMVPELAR